MTKQKPILPEERIALLEARLDQIQERVQTNNELANQNRGALELGLAHLLTLIRWAYAWSKKSNYTKRLPELKEAGESVKARLEEIEPNF